MQKIKIWFYPFVCYVAVLLVGNNALGQSHTYVVRDLESWTSLEAKVKINKKLTLGIAESFRLEHNSSQYNQLFTNLYGKYKLHKFFTVKTGVRYINQSEDEGEQNTNNLRYFISGTVKYKISNLTLKHRLMYTNKNEIGYTNKEGDVHINNIRLNTGVGYKIKNGKFDPQASVEFFRRYKGDESAWDKFRVKLGTDIDLKSLGDLEVFYGIEKEFRINKPLTTHIIGLNYSYTFKLRKHEDK